MIFGPKPSKLEQARKAALDAAHGAAASLSDAASSVSDSAHTLLDNAPKIAASVSDVVASKVEAVRHRGEEKIEEAQDSVEAAQIKAAATRKAAEVAAREAERAARDAQKKADAEIARLEKDLDRRRAEFEKQQAQIEKQTDKLGQKSDTLEAQADEIQTRRKAPLPLEKAPVTVEVHDADDEFEYHVVQEKEGGSPLWLLVGGAVFVGAALVYFFNPKSGRRARAEATDTLNKVKDNAVDKVTSATDALSRKSDEVADNVEEVANKAKEKTDAVAQAVETHEDSVPNVDKGLVDSTLDSKVRVASLDAVEGVAVDSSEEIAPIETAATAGSQLDEPQHPNIFDKITEVVGNAASAAEHLAGTEQKEEVRDENLEGEANSASPNKKKKKS